MTWLCFKDLPGPICIRGDGNTMDGYYDTRFLSRLKRSYDNPRNTLTWALFLWVFTALGFALFLPFNPAMERSICVAAGWAAIHLFRRM